jgi:hypothetical protein
MSSELVAAILILKLLGIAFMVAWFVMLVHSGHIERADTALRNFLARFNRRR